MSQTPLAKYLKMLRKKHGFTQDQLSSKLGISRTNYSHYENSMYMPSNDIFDELSQLYSVPLVNFIKLSAISGKNRPKKEAKIDGVTYETSYSPSLDPLYVEFLNNYSEMSDKDLRSYLEPEDYELVYYFHKLTNRDKLLTIQYMKTMLTITDET